MRFTRRDRTVLTLWGCERRDLTIERLAWAAAYMVAPEGKGMICSTRDKLIEDWMMHTTDFITVTRSINIRDCLE